MQNTNPHSAAATSRSPYFVILTFSGIVIAALTLSYFIFRSPQTAQPVSSVDAAHVQENYGQVPLYFEENQGQLPASVKFLTRGNGYSIALTPDKAMLELQGQRPVQVQMKLKDANANPRLVGATPLEGKMNYFIGNDSKQWKTDIPTYAQVKYEQVYPGIDVVYYGNQQQLEYDFIVAPQTDPKTIKIKFEGVSDLRLDEAGTLILATEAGEVRQHKPVVYQEVAGARREVEGNYRISQTEISFEIGQYDPSQPLIIDPTISYATLLGDLGARSDEIAVDASGNVYVAGFASAMFGVTTPGAASVNTSTSPSNATFISVVKLNSTGTRVLYAAMLGGPTPVTYGRDCDAQNPDKGKCTLSNTTNRAQGMAVDRSGNVYLTGLTVSVDFPTTPNALQRTYRHTVPYLDGNTPSTASSSGAFVMKLNSTGSGMMYSTLLGNASEGTSIAIDAQGQAVVTGYTWDDIPVKNAFQPTRQGSNDAFVAKLNANGTGLIYATYLGSESSDIGRDVTLDQDGNAYVLGETSNGGGNGDRPRGIRFPTTPGAYRTSEGDAEGLFVTKLDQTGAPLYSTLIGVASGVSIAVDAVGCAYITGWTTLLNYPVTAGAAQPKHADNCPDNCFYDTVISKLSGDGGSLEYSTYFGTEKVTDRPGGIAVTANGQLILANQKTYENANGVVVSDTQVVKFSEDGASVVYTQLLSGCQPEGLALDPSGNIYVTGPATGRFSPTPNTYRTYGAGTFVAKIIEANPPRSAFYSLSGTITFDSGRPPFPTYPGVKVFLQGAVNRAAITDDNGRYSFDRLPAGGDYFVFPDPMNTPTTSSYSRMVAVKNLSTNQVVNFGVRDYKSRLVSNVSAASYTAGGFACDSIISAFGPNLTSVTQAATQLPLPTEIENTRVTITDSDGTERQAMLLFISPTQVNYILPANLALGPAIVRIWGRDGHTSTELIQIEPITPGLFTADATGRGVAAANVQRVKANGAQTYEQVSQFDTASGRLMPMPIDLGVATDSVYLTLFGTGVRNCRVLENVSATIGGVKANVTYVGSQNSFVGLDQINIMIPRELAGRGDVDVVLNVEGKPANVVKVKIK